MVNLGQKKAALQKTAFQYDVVFNNINLVSKFYDHLQLWFSSKSQIFLTTKNETKQKNIVSICNWEKKTKTSLMDSGLVIMMHFINSSPGYCTFPISSFLVSFGKPIVSWKKNKSKASVFIMQASYWVAFCGLLLAEDPYLIFCGKSNKSLLTLATINLQSPPLFCNLTRHRTLWSGQALY